MPRCYVLPGILGSELYTDVGGARKLWVNVPRLALGEFDRLELAADGSSPKPPRGFPCRAGVPLEDHYGDLLQALEAGLEDAGYQIVPWGYDWRLRVFPVALPLAEEIRQNVTPQAPCTIVAHSQGGLVARAVWQLLGNSGQGSLVRRIITIGTPHRGSYAPCLVWSLQEELLEQLSLLCNSITGIADPLAIMPLSRYWTRIQLAAITASWPSMYELMPLLDDRARIADPDRAAVYDAQAWPDSLNLFQAQLDEARDQWRSFLLDPTSMPPAEILTTAGGYGYPTPVRMAQVEEIGSPEAFSFSTQGDGRVALDSSLVDRSRQLTLQAQHGNIMNSGWLHARMIEDILADRLPPAPVPGALQNPLPEALYGTAPPLRLTPDFGHDC